MRLWKLFLFNSLYSYVELDSTSYYYYTITILTIETAIILAIILAMLAIILAVSIVISNV